MMKCTDFSPMFDEIKKREWSELKAALMAHGGEFTWLETDEETFDEIVHADPPYVLALTEYGPVDVRIHKAWYDMQNGLEFEAEDNSTGSMLLSLDFHDIIPGNCESVIRSIPATDKVTDVTNL